MTGSGDPQSLVLCILDFSRVGHLVSCRIGLQTGVAQLMIDLQTAL